MTLTRFAGHHAQICAGTTSTSSAIQGDLREYEYGMETPEIDVTGFEAGVQFCIPDIPNAHVNLEGFHTIGTAGTHPIFKTMGTAAGMVTMLLLGQNATPVVGDYAFGAKGLKLNYPLRAAIHEAMNTDIRFLGDVDSDLVGMNCRVLVPITTITDTTTGTSVNWGAGTTAGAVGWLAVLTATSTDSYSVIVEHSTTGAWGGEETTLLTFAADAQTTLCEKKTATGTVNQYTRYKATRTGAAADDFELAVILTRL